MEIEELDLSVRAFSVLKRANINTVEQLCSKTEEDILRLRGCGAHVLTEIHKHLNAIGLDFSSPADFVNVVRCRDCKHFDNADGDNKCVIDAEGDEEAGFYSGFISYRNPDFYCADGERK